MCFSEDCPEKVITTTVSLIFYTNHFLIFDSDSVNAKINYYHNAISVKPKSLSLFALTSQKFVFTLTINVIIINLV